MNESWPVLTAVWLGLLTAASPCPLATNLAAVAFLGRHVGSPKRALLHGCIYAAGRATAYALVAIAVISGLLAAPGLSRWLQRQGDRWLWLLLVTLGAVLLAARRLPSWGGGIGDRVSGWAAAGGAAGAFGLGAVFALAFCPVSAALFFGSLIPLAVGRQSAWLLPVIYGLATGLPVAVLAVALASGTAVAARAFRFMGAVERRAVPATGIALIAIGMYLRLRS